MVLNVLSLFSGIGAFEKALDRVGINYKLVGYSEIEHYASKIYSEIHNVPEELNLGDIRKINEKELEDFDIMFWGFPCTNFSKATRDKEANRRGLKNDASGLYYEGLRILKEKKPMISIIENVPDLIGKDFKNQFDEIISDLKELGYINNFKILRAQDYNVVQNRERLFIVSIREDIYKGFNFPEAIPLIRSPKDILKGKEFIEDKFLKINPNIIDRVKTRKLRNNSICPTITKAIGRGGSSSEYISNCAFVYQNTGDLRRMTPREALLFMDFSEEDFCKAKKVSTDTAIFNASGNSICVGVAEALLRELFIKNNYMKIREEPEINEMHKVIIIKKKKNRLVHECQLSFF